MKKLKFVLLILTSLVLWFLTDFTFSIQHIGITFFVTSLIYLVVATLVGFGYLGKQKNIISIIFLVPQLLFAIFVALANKALFPFFTPGVLIVCMFNYFFGLLIAFCCRNRKYLLFIFIVGWLLLVYYLGFKMIALMEFKEYNIVENKDVASFKLLSRDKDTLDSDQLRNKIIVLDFWTTKCGVCYRLFPKIQELADYYHDNKNILIIAVNDGKTDSIEGFQKAKGIDKYTFPFMYDLNKTLHENLNIEAYPITCIIDKKGKLRYRHIGCGKDEMSVIVSEFIKQIDILLAE
jgi:thiol-disulfide isomerase/thioredoxin